jgi:histidinol-phosphate/aromatic aminotransferase/cobyric acid decarboxylase-like protein
MDSKNVSRRKFVGGLAAALGYVSTGPNLDVFAQQGRAAGQGRPGGGAGGGGRGQTAEQYDAMAKLANNENNYGIPPSVMKEMEGAWKYAGRYGYPDPGLNQAIAEFDGVKTENLMVTAGSGEVLDVVGTTFLQNGKKVLGVEPSYSAVYQHATSIKSDAIKLPLTKDYRQDIGMIIDAAKKHQAELGFVYICNPNNPTGQIVTKQEIKQLLDGLPAGRPFASGSVNVLARYGATATLKNPALMQEVKRKTLASRDKTMKDLKALGYEVIPSQANFFMVGLRREVQPVIQAFREEGVLVGRPFSPMTQHLRVSVGVPEEMDRFMVAFKKVMAMPATTTAGKQ